MSIDFALHKCDGWKDVQAPTSMGQTVFSHRQHITEQKCS